MNLLSKEKQTVIIGSLAEGSSIRSIERLTGVHRDTIMRLGVRVGEVCHQILDQKMRGLNCSRIEVDELWGSFLGLPVLLQTMISLTSRVLQKFSDSIKHRSLFLAAHRC